MCEAKMQINNKGCEVEDWETLLLLIFFLQFALYIYILHTRHIGVKLVVL